MPDPRRPDPHSRRYNPFHQPFSLGALEALHHPCRSLEQSYLARYSEQQGDFSLRLVVIAYTHLEAGGPVWHASLMVRGERGLLERSEWSRQQQSRGERALEHHIGALGGGRTYVDRACGISTRYAMHRVRPLTEQEREHLPQGLRLVPIDLGGELV